MPRIKTTRTVTAALFFLRLYLVGMLLLILAKFVLDSRRVEAKPEGPAPAASPERSEKGKG